ncbi:hypothetical protein OGAPHI_004969 [Ogataea philodendri]|uniref:CAP-Gly domain-containing protein n=1 Tax=Ogataea philodendri TaxID=1378263 RepID=A0A9P8P0Z9_9ASCO|nr:uncharacterized protein OGAPHI_004969 [Ogataea philodendri]KAH3663568.1 hypothetical protein OGAPHI_004969 [Ogataea philodendri]
MSIQVGSRVSIPGGGEAYVRFIGTVRNKNGTFAGVELVGESVNKGKNSGDVDGTFYFRTKVPRTGLFLPYHKLVQANSSPLRPVTRTNVMNSPKSSPQNADHRVQELSEQNRLYKQQLAERTRILEDFQETVGTFEALLTENQNELKMKDARFERYKSNTDTQIKELIEAVETLEQQAQENEEIYMRRLRELEAQKETGSADTKTDEQKQFEVLEQRCKELEEGEKTLNMKLSAVQAELEASRRETEKLQQEKTEIASALQTLQKSHSDLQSAHTALRNAPPPPVPAVDEFKVKYDELRVQYTELAEKCARLEAVSSAASAPLVQNGELIATPAVKSDPAAGRAKWCGLCEREGHESVECPYENVMF